MPDPTMSQPGDPSTSPDKSSSSSNGQLATTPVEAPENNYSREKLIDEFLSDLTCYDEKNFSEYHPDSSTRSIKRITPYIPVFERPSEQIIVTDNTNVLLRYLHLQWEKRRLAKKREVGSFGYQDGDDINRKRSRLESP